ncbi:hypothetical protein SAMN06265219_10742 [Gracilimonas mengyeensis]|uniref:Uncharacterized protein n=2 Tax=Gracilimonas mengyeensis TaxID=1302730 RepID=A0A521D1R8_9BACT|nr:hypothetical protein SAMN06265219_10742 [Gracilimonas mengyeensis]
MMAIVLPVKILGFAESHSIYSVFNADEGCFELVVDHHENADGFHLMDEENDAHSFHSSCCFDNLALTFKKQDTDFDLPVSYGNDCDGFSHISERPHRPITLQEHPLPPPESQHTLRITRLLI